MFVCNCRFSCKESRPWHLPCTLFLLRQRRRRQNRLRYRNEGENPPQIGCQLAPPPSPSSEPVDREINFLLFPPPPPTFSPHCCSQDFHGRRIFPRQICVATGRRRNLDWKAGGGREAEGGGGVSIMLCEGDASPSLSPFFGYRDRGYGV